MKVLTIRCLMLFVMPCMTIDHVLAADAIILRTTVIPENAWVGQKVLLQVDVLAKEGWAQVRKVADVEVDGAYMLRLESQGTRLSETIEGDSYLGQRYEFMLFAQRDGKVTIEPVAVDVEVKTWGAGGGTRIERRSLPGVEFIARTPPGAQGTYGLISTSNFTANQEWDRQTESPVVGDAIKRTITLRAQDVSGMAFAPMRYGEIEGVGIYPGEPTVDDQFARGDLTGTRIETITFVFEHAGEIEIPDVYLSWWDVSAEELKQIVLPGLSLSITESAAAGSGTQEQSYKSFLWLALLAMTIAVIVALSFAGKLTGRWAAWRRSRKENEATLFRQLRRSARSRDSKAVLRDTMRWLDRINESSRPARLDQFLRKYGNGQSQLSILDLDKPGITTFLSELAVARKRWQTSNQSKQRAVEWLPDFNGGT